MKNKNGYPDNYFDGRNEGEPPYVSRFPTNRGKEEKLGYKLAQKEITRRWKEYLNHSKNTKKAPKSGVFILY